MRTSTRRIVILGLALLWAAPARAQRTLEDLMPGQKIRIKGVHPNGEIVWKARGPGQHGPDEATLAVLHELHGQQITVVTSGSDGPVEGVVGRLEGVRGDTILIARDWPPGTHRILATEGTIIGGESLVGSLEGNFHSVTDDSLYVATKGTSHLRAFPLESFAEAGNTLEAHRGGHPVRKAALVGAAAVGAFGFSLGGVSICPGGGSCEAEWDLGGSVQLAAAGAALGAAAGGVIGRLASDPFEEVFVNLAIRNPRASAVGPVITPGGQRATGEVQPVPLYRLLGQEVRISSGGSGSEPIVGRLEGFRGDTILMRQKHLGGVARIKVDRETLIQRPVRSSMVPKALIGAVAGGALGAFEGTAYGSAVETVSSTMIGAAVGFGIAWIIGRAVSSVHPVVTPVGYWAPAWSKGRGGGR